MEKMSRYLFLLNDSLLYKFLQPTFIAVYGFETMVIKTDNQNWEN